MSTTLNLKPVSREEGGDMKSKITMETHATHARARYFTVRYLPVEIDAQEAVSRFLNVHGKSGGQSVNF